MTDDVRDLIYSVDCDTDETGTDVSVSRITIYNTRRREQMTFSPEQFQVILEHGQDVINNSIEKTAKDQQDAWYAKENDKPSHH